MELAYENPYKKRHRRRLFDVGFNDGATTSPKQSTLAEKPEGYAYLNGYERGQEARERSMQADSQP